MKFNVTKSQLLIFVLVILFVSNFLLITLYSKPKGDAYLGVVVKDISTMLEKHLGLDHGVIITWIDEKGPASAAGLDEDDIIVEINKERIDSPNELRRIVRKFSPDEEIKVAYLREGKKSSISIKLAEAPESKSAWHDQRFDFREFPFGERPYIGITLHVLDADLSKYFGVQPDDGVLILEIEEGSPAEKAELKSGDVILEVNDKKVSKPEEIQDIISDCDEGDELTLKIMRHKQNLTIKVEVEIKESKYRMFMKQIPGHLEDLRFKIEEEINHEEIEKMDQELEKFDRDRIFIPRDADIIRI
ncbi:PDZ domain-containing protein [candidate division KSB1 bacterium]|nr:PDZ domain-containing protein [candidate division KSB1 bacterium]